MTALDEAVASGQVSPAQIEAHRVAGELPIVMFEPRFQHTYCSQCGRDCGPGDDGVSGCADHAAIAQPVQPAHNGMEIVGHQYQWTNPADGSEPDVYLLEWKAVQPGWNQTVQQKIDELLAYRYVGKPTYRVRGIYTSTNIAQPVQPEPTNSTALDASELLNQCESFLSLHDDVKRNIVSELDAAIKATS